MYRIVASDLDETFLAPGHVIPEGNMDAVRRMRELGVLFVPCSGRPYPSIMADFEGEDQSLFEGGYVLSYNGGCINRYGDPKPIASSTIDRASAERIFAFGLEHGICTHAYTLSGKICIFNAPDTERRRFATTRGVVWMDDVEPRPSDLSFTGDDAVVKILLSNEDFSLVRGYAEEVRPMLDPALVRVTFSSNHFAEFVGADVNKGKGLAQLAALLGVDMTDTIGVGDAANDLELIQAAGLGVGVANASDDLRPSCDLILDTAGPDGAFPELVRRVIEPGHTA